MDNKMMHFFSRLYKDKLISRISNIWGICLVVVLLSNLFDISHVFYLYFTPAIAFFLIARSLFLYFSHKP